MRQLTNCTFLQVIGVGFCEMHLCLMLTKHYSNTVGLSIEEVRHACTNHYEWSALASWAWPTVLMGGQETCLYIGLYCRDCIFMMIFMAQILKGYLMMLTITQLYKACPPRPSVRTATPSYALAITSCDNLHARPNTLNFSDSYISHAHWVYSDGSYTR